MPLIRLFLMICFATVAVFAQAERPRPYPVVPDRDFRDAVKAGTRTMTGEPGPAYWQNRADYKLHVRLLPTQKRLEGIAVITYHNNSPDTLRSLRLSLLQNIHKEGTIRLRNQEVTGGYELNSVAVNGERLSEGGRSGARYFVNTTSLLILPSKPTPPGGTATMSIDYAFKIPQAGVGARMGYDTDSLFYIAYWYPQMAVFNDVVDWQDDPFLGGAEFYSDFGNYEYTIQMPDDWLLWGTGTVLNPKETFADFVLERLEEARNSDETFRIVGPEDFGKTTKAGKDGWLTWKFRADNVRDVAWLATRHSVWEAARTPMGKGAYAMAHGFWRESASKWKRSVEFTQQSISFLSEYTSIRYPWPHMTAIEAGGIISGGMEYPMMTLIGNYNRAPNDLGLLGVHAHEEAHMWVPMIVNVDERRYGWMDEGTTSYHTDEALRSIVPDSVKPEDRFNGYLALARQEGEGEMMRWSNFHNNGNAYGVASYAKPASILHMLKGVLGEETFLRTFRKYLTTWAWKHPYPWDMFNTFAAESGKNLDWYMRSWYYETWTLDHAVREVTETESGTNVTVEDKGWVPMPVLLSITREDGTTETLRISEDVWLSGKNTATTQVGPGAPVVRVEIDPDYYFADIDRGNNTWEKEKEQSAENE